MSTGIDAVARPSARKRSRAELERAAWEPFLNMMQAERIRMMEVWQELGLTPPQAFTLLNLSRQGPCSMASLAEAMKCDASNITGIVDKLEARGLIARQPHQQDRRVKLLLITEDGEALRAQLKERMATPPALFGVLSVDELKTLSGILSKVRLAPGKQ